MSGQTVIILTADSPNPWTVPADFNPSNNIIEAIGGGAGGAGPMNSGDGRGGGGGAYAKKTNFDPEGEATIPYTIGEGGAPDADGAATTFFDGHTLLATYGKAVSPESGASGGLGGLAADCVPTLGAHSGGDGYYDDVLGLNAGGGGAAGPDGDGQIADDEIGGDGGSPRGGAGGAAGIAGSGGTTWQDTDTLEYAGPGGGGGSASDGGQYGGGGGAGALVDGTGGGGVIVISYTPLEGTPVLNAADAPMLNAANQPIYTAGG